MTKYKYKGTDLEDIFGTNNGVRTNINFGNMPNFSKTTNNYARYKTNELSRLNLFQNNGTNTLDDNFTVTNASRNSDGQITVPEWANAVKIRMVGLKGVTGDTGEDGQGGEIGQGGDIGAGGDEGEDGQAGAQDFEKSCHQNGGFTETGFSVGIHRQRYTGGGGGSGGEGGPGGDGGTGGKGGYGGDGGTGGGGGDGGAGGVNIFEDVFTFVNNTNSVLSFNTGNPTDNPSNATNTTLTIQTDGNEVLNVALEPGHKGFKGFKGYKGYKGYKGFKGIRGHKGFKGFKGGTGNGCTNGGWVENNIQIPWFDFLKGQGGENGQSHNVWRDGTNGSTGATGGKNNNKGPMHSSSQLPGGNTSKNPSGGPSNTSVSTYGIKGIKGITRGFTLSGTKTTNTSVSNSFSTTQTVDDVPQIYVSFFTVDETL